MSLGWWLRVWLLAVAVFLRDWHAWMGSFDDE